MFNGKAGGRSTCRNHHCLVGQIEVVWGAGLKLAQN